MEIIRVINSWTLIFLMVYSALCETNISLHSKITSDNRFVIICEAWGRYINTTSVHLNCPLIDSKICYMNCEAPCVMEDDLCQIPSSLKPISKCTATRLQYDRVRYEYLLDNRLIKSNGQWSCTYRGENSRKIIIDKYDQAEPTKKPLNKEEPKKPSYDYENFIPPKKEIKNNFPRDEGGTNQRNYDFGTSNRNSGYGLPNRGFDSSRQGENTAEDYPESFTDAKLVIGLLIMLVLSLLVNIAFCLRCVLFKCYKNCSQNNGSVEQPCLEKLLCIAPDPYRKYNSSNQSGHPIMTSRQESSVYEDLNGFGSQRRMTRQPPSAITQVETIVDENGVSMYRYPMMHNGVPPSPVPSNRSASTNHPLYYKMPANYYQNGYGQITPPPGNYVYLATHPHNFNQSRSHTTIYDDVPFELRPQSNHVESRQGSQYPDSEMNEPQMNQSVLQEEDENNLNMAFPPPPPPLDGIPLNFDNQSNASQSRQISREVIDAIKLSQTETGSATQ